MIKTNYADSAGRNNLSGRMELPCLGSLRARRRGLGRNAGGVSDFFFFVDTIFPLKNQSVILTSIIKTSYISYV